MLSLRETAARKLKPSNLFIHPANYSVMAIKDNKIVNVNVNHITKNQIINSGLLDSVSSFVNNKNFSNHKYIRTLEMYGNLHHKVYRNSPNSAPTRLVVLKLAMPYLKYLFLK